MIRIEKVIFSQVIEEWPGEEFLSETSIHPESSSFWKACWPDPGLGMKPEDIDISICGAHHSVNSDFELLGQKFPSLETFCGIAGSNCVGEFPSPRAAMNCVELILALCCTYFGRNIVSHTKLNDNSLEVFLRNPK